MVYFTCQGCGEPVKKPQVEKHKQQCRRSRILTCIDCSVDFADHEYQTHTSCVTEDKKYGGQNFKAKENKGEMKQKLWYEQVQRAIDSVNSSNSYLKYLLEKLRNYPNIPRKEAKFKNFVLNSLRERNSGIVAEAWMAISKAEKNDTVPTKSELKSSSPTTEMNKNETESANGTIPTKPSKKRVLSEDEPIENGSSMKKFKTEDSERIPKLKSMMKKFLNESESGTIKLRKLKKRVANEMNLENDEEKEKLYEKIDSKLSSTSNFFVLDGKYVKLKKKIVDK